LLDADLLSGEGLTEADLLESEADATAPGCAIVEGIIEFGQTDIPGAPGADIGLAP
jgi:hypothetical protein